MSSKSGNRNKRTNTVNPAITQATDLLEALEADRYASEMDETLLYLDELDADACPPDRVYDLGDREAWIYEHGNIAELVFVRA